LVNYLCSGRDFVATQLGGLMDKPWRHQWDGRIIPQRLVEHGVEEGQPTKVILGDRLVTAHLLDLLIESILACQGYVLLRVLVPAREQYMSPSKSRKLACISGFLASSYIAHSVVTNVVSVDSISASHTSIVNWLSVRSPFSDSIKSK
jgi:hypothetical protein